MSIQNDGYLIPQLRMEHLESQKLPWKQNSYEVDVRVNQFLNEWLWYIDLFVLQFQ